MKLGRRIRETVWCVFRKRLNMTNERIIVIALTGTVVALIPGEERARGSEEGARRMKDEERGKKKGVEN